jgi:malate synthase/heterodisulfide reductase subunit B
VALLTGCAQSVLDPGINAAAVRLLNRFGVEVVTPRGEGCCGAIVHHMGREKQGVRLARHNVDVWTREIEGEGLDAIVVTASGCGTAIKDYGHNFRLEPAYADKAARISALTLDITEFLARLDLPRAERSTDLRVAYHSACSMQHGQRITTLPKLLLEKAGFVVSDIPEGHICCGSAGTYNILQPEIATRLRDRKIRNIDKVAPDVIATGNIGCMTHIGAGTIVPVVHTIELLDWAYGSEASTSKPGGRPCGAHVMRRDASALEKGSGNDGPGAGWGPGGRTRALRLHRRRGAPRTGVPSEQFWSGLDAVVHDLAPKNRELLEKRDRLQAQIDAWHRERGDRHFDLEAYKEFLREIGYLLPEGPDFSVGTENVDPEIAEIAGPQLVVPVMNARYALNAANARWGSLYDALYGTDALGSPPPKGAFDAERGRAVIARARACLDEAAPLLGASWSEATAFAVREGALAVTLGGDRTTELQDRSQFAGYLGDPRRLTGSCSDATASASKCGSMRLPLSARTTRHMFGRLAGSGDHDHHGSEDSIAAVDAEDKVAAYRNWLGLMKGDLAEEVTKGGRTFTRKLNPDIDYLAPDGSTFRVRCRSLMLVRNVGHLMRIDAVRDRDGNPVPEGILDAMVTAALALHDVGPNGGRMNSRAGSVYIVKPKMHGPEEVGFADEVFGRVEDALGMARNTLKMGIMDEERRTTLNLKSASALPGPHRVHQHRLPRPHRRRDPHLHGSRAGDPQGRHEGGAVDPGL